MKGIINNKKRELTAEATEHFKKGKVAHVATVGEDGYLYVIRFVYVHEGDTKL